LISDKYLKLYYIFQTECEVVISITRFKWRSAQNEYRKSSNIYATCI